MQYFNTAPVHSGVKVVVVEVVVVVVEVVLFAETGGEGRGWEQFKPVKTAVPLTHLCTIRVVPLH
jgi:hypothetical protein